MKRVMTALVLFLLVSPTQATPMQQETIEARIQRIADKSALKELVDTFSNLADIKDVKTQVLLFTPDATVESYSGGKLSSSLKGRDELAERFGAFLDMFNTVYHINGQQVVDITGDSAIGTAYSQVVLIRSENGKEIRRTSGVRYEDEYLRVDGKWLINKRISHFMWNALDEAPLTAE